MLLVIRRSIVRLSGGLSVKPCSWSFIRVRVRLFGYFLGVVLLLANIELVFWSTFVGFRRCLDFWRGSLRMTVFGVLLTALLRWLTALARFWLRLFRFGRVTDWELVLCRLVCVWRTSLLSFLFWWILRRCRRLVWYLMMLLSWCLGILSGVGISGSFDE